jgi:polyisoprenoid-binding protein YceI
MKALATAILFSLAMAAPAGAAEWAVDKDLSSVTFETTAFGQQVSGGFADFGADISLDPDEPSWGSIDAYVETGSVETGSPDIDSALLGEGGFNTSGYMRARFVSEEIRAARSCDAVDAVCLVASGMLTVRGVAQPQELAFTLRTEGDRAIADGAFLIRRNEFGIGTAEWELAGSETTVHLHIVADARP